MASVWFCTTNPKVALQPGCAGKQVNAHSGHQQRVHLHSIMQTQWVLVATHTGPNWILRWRPGATHVHKQSGACTYMQEECFLRYILSCAVRDLWLLSQLKCKKSQHEKSADLFCVTLMPFLLEYIHTAFCKGICHELEPLNLLSGWGLLSSLHAYYAAAWKTIHQ